VRQKPAPDQAHDKGSPKQLRTKRFGMKCSLFEKEIRLRRAPPTTNAEKMGTAKTEALGHTTTTEFLFPLTARPLLFKDPF
jgi:hypothetical protein